MDLFLGGELQTVMQVPSQMAAMDEKPFDPRGKFSPEISERGETSCFHISNGEKQSPFHVTVALTTFGDGSVPVPPGIIQSGKRKVLPSEERGLFFGDRPKRFQQKWVQ